MGTKIRTAWRNWRQRNRENAVERALYKAGRRRQEHTGSAKTPMEDGGGWGEGMGGVGAGTGSGGGGGGG